MNIINKFIKTARIYVFSVSLLKYFILWLLFSYTFLFIWSCADYYIIFQRSHRLIFYFASLLCGAGFAFKYVIANMGYLKDYNLIVFIQNKIPELGDDLVNSWQLGNSSNEGMSDDLINKFIENTEEKIKNTNPLSIVNIKTDVVKPLKLLISVILVTAIVFVYPQAALKTSLKRVLLSFSVSSWRSCFLVIPETVTFPYASAVSITIKEKQQIKALPSLFLRSSSAKWEKIDLEFDSAKKEYSYTIDRLCERIEYYLSWQDLETEVFTLTPIMSPQLGEFVIKCKYPDYTGLGVVERKGNPNITALKGSAIEFKAKTNKTLKKAELVVNNKKHQVFLNKGFISARFVIEKNSSYGFVLEAEDGSFDPEPPQYQISAVDDQPPVIELVSPNQDLVVADDTEIPLVFNAADDFILTKIKLHYKIDKKEDSIDINPKTAKTFQDTYEYTWKISRLGLKPSQKVRYYLEAFDNDTVNGPKSGVSSAYSFEIMDYEKEHNSLEDGFKDFRNELLKILADETVAKSKTESLKTIYSTSTYQSLNSLQKNIKDNMQKPLDMLSKLLLRMETDPLTDFSTYSEYKGLASHLENMKDNTMPEAQKAIEEKKWDKAKMTQEEIIASLEKMALLSEDIWHYQKMKDVLETGSKLEKAGSDLMDQLSGAPKPEELQKALNNIQDLMAQISKRLFKMPQELPEDFINSPAVKNIDLKSSQDLLSELSEAIARGDWEKAKALAKSLSEKLSSTLKTLDEAGKNIGFSSDMADKMQDKLSKHNENLEKVIKQQENLNKEIEKMDTLRQKALFKKQEDILKQLLIRQKAATLSAEKISGKAAGYYWKFPDTIKLMKKVLAEFEQKRVYHSQKYLEDVIVDLVSLQRITGSIYGVEEDFKKTNLFLVTEEQDILEKLKHTAKGEVFTENDKKNLQEISNGQNNIAKQAKSLRNSVEELTRQSASVNPAISENLYQAQRQMESGSGQLMSSDTPGAIESGNKALEYLENSRNSLQSAKEQLSNQGKNAGKPKGSSVQMRSGSGMTGFKTAPVKLPKIDEYKPPKEFRQEIMDALKEKYPVEYDKIIKEYYRKLTE